LCVAPALAGDGGGWVEFNDETGSRSVVASNLFANDSEEKDYAWGDVDNDGDTDLVIVRKQPFTSPGRRTNVLLINEGIADGRAIDGVLVDRTAAYATASDIPGDQGFQTPTNDRDVVLVDVDLDGWLDMVTATTLTDNDEKHLSHPRVYMNLGEVDGVWQGFEYQDARIPQMHPTAGPRFCSVAAGDLTGDGYPDLYFGDYDSGGTQIYDYNNRLLINDGNGFFSDQSTDRLTDQMRESAFGAASVICDMNGDGVLDVVKQTSLNSPTHVAITYNNLGNEGYFDYYDTIYFQSPYFVSAGDLNGDGMLDLVIVDDGTDRVLMNTGNDSQGRAQFVPQSLSGTNGFGGNDLMCDLNNDGDNDIIITDVDVDIPGCNRRTFIFRNLGGASPSFQEQDQPIPSSMLNGVHDVAAFDLNGDGALDLVMGRCGSTEIWINDPPVTGLAFNYLSGLPSEVVPGETTTIEVKIVPLGSTPPVDGSGMMHYAVNGGPVTDVPMTLTASNLYTVDLPALACTDRADFYFSAQVDGGTTFTDPPAAPASMYTAISRLGVDIVRNDFETDVTGWEVQNDDALTAGAWELADPNGTLDFGNQAAPDSDATAGAENVLAFVTDNGPAGGAANANDIDGGTTHLISPVIDLDGSDATISYARWFYSSYGTTDFLTVAVSNDGGDTWVPVPSQTTGSTDQAWETVEFLVSAHVEPTANVRIRFTAEDDEGDSITEAGIDNFEINRTLCEDEQPCPTDTNGDGNTDVDDLVAVILAWGSDDPAADVNGSGEVDVDDLLDVILAWGACD
jgi:hypothetical protein